MQSMKNGNARWHQKIFLWWVDLSFLDKILFYLFCAAFFVIVIPSILNDFFYASVYFTDFSISFSIILLFFCVFWLGYFSGHTEKGESKKIEWLKNLENLQKPKKSKKPENSRRLDKGILFQKWLKKNKMPALSQKFKHQFLPIQSLPRALYRMWVMGLQKKVSPKFALSLGIYYQSHKNIKTRGSDIKSYTRIKDMLSMPSLLPLPSRDKNKKRSYSLMIKKMKEESSMSEG